MDSTKEKLIDFLFKIGDYLFVFYLPAVLAGIFIYKAFNSFVISSIVVIVAEGLMHRIRDPLKLHVANASDVIIGRIEWFGTWITLYLVFMTTMYLMHKIIDVSEGRIAVSVKWCFLALCGLQFSMYLVKSFAPGWLWFYPIYQYGVASINIGLGVILYSHLAITIIANYKKNRGRYGILG